MYKKTAAQRVLSLNLKRKRYDAEIVQRYILYRGAKLEINDEMFTELLSLIPEIWNSDKDRLVQFVLFEDNTFFSVRDKDVYNFSLKETQTKTYFFNAATPQQVAELVRILTDYFGKKKIEEVGDLYDAIIDSLNDLSFMKQRILYMREEALFKSDYMFNSDYSFKDAETEEAWKNYRQQWRDITSSEAWQNGDFQSLSIPMAPKPLETYKILFNELKNSLSSVEVTDNLLKDMALTIDCAEYKNLADNFGDVYFKLEILKTLNKLKIPFNTTVGEDTSEIDGIEESLASINLLPMDVYMRYKSTLEIEDDETNFTMKDIVDQQISAIDAKIEAINSKLADYNVNYTITDILAKYVEDTKAKALDIEREYEAENLIAELQFGVDE